MIKTGRNDPCHCGSGKKYKRCCLQKDQIAKSAALAQAAAARTAEAAQHDQEARNFRGHFGDDEDDLTGDSNAVVDLVQQGQLDQAEAAARELLVRYPEVHDGYDRLGMVYEARGEPKQAADCYRKVIEFVLAHPEQYDPEFSTTFERLVLKLDPPNATS
jgi:tetratricopeptide (TPR) repeat protein